jgi:hypothetical protein
MTDLEKQLLRRIDLLQRGVPFHVHIDTQDAHEWECSSSYCPELRRDEAQGPQRGPHA